MSVFLLAMLLENISLQNERKHHRKHRKHEVYHDIYDSKWINENSVIKDNKMLSNPRGNKW